MAGKRNTAKRALPSSFGQKSTPSGGGRVKKTGGGGRTKHTIIWKPTTVLRTKKK